METTQKAEPPPDISEVKLRIPVGDPKASEAYFQNSLNSTTPGLCQSIKGKSPAELQKGVPRDENRNRLKSTIIMPANGDDVNGITVPLLYSSDVMDTASCSEAGNGKSKNGSSDAGGITGNHVEIDVDMTLSQQLPVEVTQKEDAIVKRSDSASNEIISNGQKTDSTDCHNSKNNSKSTVVTINNLSNSNTAQSSSVTLGQNQGDRFELQHQPRHQQQPTSPKLQPSCEKDLEILKNVRKVNVQLTDDNTPCYYKVSDESQECLFETILGDTNGSIWSRYFKQQQKVILVHDRNQRGVLKLEFGRSRTISCCQTLRFAAMTASFKLKPEEPLCIIFKDKECCVSCCCCPEATYETVPQLDIIHPFSVFTKGRWKNRAELMVKHNDGSILGFIDKEQNSYSLTMGENLGPSMKICLIGFLIAMDVMDREDATKLSCYLRPTSILLLLLLICLCLAIGGYLIQHFSSFNVDIKDDSVICGTFDGRAAPVPHVNNDRTSDSIAMTSNVVNATSSSLNEFNFGVSSSSDNTDGNAGIGAAATSISGGNNTSNNWALF